MILLLCKRKYFSYFLPVPTVAPTNTTGEDLSSSSLLIKWLPIPIEHHQGNIIGYAIKYEFIDFDGYDYRGGKKSGISECPGDVNLKECEIHGLALFTNFSIQVGAMTVAGIGVWSCLLYTSPSPRDKRQSRMPSSA